MTRLSRSVGQGDPATVAPPPEAARRGQRHPHKVGGPPKRTAQTGATVVEYAILVALIATAVIVTVSVVGGQVDAAFQDLLKLIEEHFPTGTGNRD